MESFARYVALRNPLPNFDDTSGPGRDHHPWYDLDTRRFAVVTWAPACPM